MSVRYRNDSNYNNEWDTLREEYNNSSYEPQFADEVSSQLDHCRLYIRNIPKGLNEEGLRTAFSKYGTLTELHLSKDPLKKYGLVRYETPGEAKLAMTKLHNTEPMKFSISIAYKPKKKDAPLREHRDTERNFSSRSIRDDNSVGSRDRSFKQFEDMADAIGDSLPALGSDLDTETKMKGLQLELERLQVQEQAVLLKQRLFQLEQQKKNLNQSNSTSNRCILPNGKIQVQNVKDRNLESGDVDGTFAAGAGDSNEREYVCSCYNFKKWDQPASSGSSTPSTCVLCSEESQKNRHNQAKSSISKYTELRSNYSSRFDKTTEISKKSVASRTTDVKYDSSKTDTNGKSDVTSKMLHSEKGRKSNVTCDLKYSDFYSDSDNEADETNRLIQLRSSDYLDIVGDTLKIVITLAGYPKSKMRLRQMEWFQKCLTDIIDLQLKGGLLKKVPSFLDYYLNRGAIVCICKDLDTRNWVVRVSPGLQERMCTNLILMKPRVKRLCLAMMKIPEDCWPATAKDAFKLLQYFNPTLRTDTWKIYSQSYTNNVEHTSFLIDRASGELIRGPTFKNVIDYNQMEFELTGYAEIYYECLLSDLEEDLFSVSSRVKLLEELRSGEQTPIILSADKLRKQEVAIVGIEKQTFTETHNNECDSSDEDTDDENDCEKEEFNRNQEVKESLENALQKEVLKKLKDVEYNKDKEEILVWCDETNKDNSDHENKKEEIVCKEKLPTTTDATESEKAESVIESVNNLISRSSNLNIDSNRGIAYHRRTNYLHVEDELKVAVALVGYPQNKLEGTHIRRLKHLFKEYLHRDMKAQRFSNLIIPKFLDVYLSNGAVIYICDSLETKDYLTNILPKFINSTGLKLTFRDIKSLVRYTRLVLRLPKEYAHVESLEILHKLQEKYPCLKPDCWKYYSDIAGKQKRQFGVDPESLEVIKNPDFDPTYEGEKLSFRIIDRKKRDASYDESNTVDESVDNDVQNQSLRNKVVKCMYVPVDPDITNTPLTRIRANHYSNIIADDLKLYVGPASYPEKRIDETLFHAIKKMVENIVCEEVEHNKIDETRIPTFHDMYLFDGVIFIICQNFSSKEWLEGIIQSLNERIAVDLKATEYRGAVGIVSMIVNSQKDTDEVIDALQKQNSRLRTKYWRKISTVRTKSKSDVVLQIDKLSAQVITSPEFNNHVDGTLIQFKLGHLQSLMKAKSSLDVFKKRNKQVAKKPKPDSSAEKTIEELRSDLNEKYPELKIDQWDVISLSDSIAKICKFEIDTDSKANEEFKPSIVEAGELDQRNVSDEKLFVKLPSKLIPDNNDDLHMLFDMLEDKNPGLNTELWRVCSDSMYSSYGRYSLRVDKQSAAIIRGKNFDPIIGGERLKFVFPKS